VLCWFPVSALQASIILFFGQAFGLATQGLVAPSGLLHPGLYIFRPYGPLPGLRPSFLPIHGFTILVSQGVVFLRESWAWGSCTSGYTYFGPTGLYQGYGLVFYQSMASPSCCLKGNIANPQSNALGQAITPSLLPFRQHVGHLATFRIVFRGIFTS